MSKTFKRTLIIIVIVALIFSFVLLIAFFDLSIFSEYGGTTICYGIVKKTHNPYINRCLGLLFYQYE